MVRTLRPKDHDFIKTIEGFYFCVIGYEHPDERIISYLKYVPWETGKWKDSETYLKRVLKHYSASEVLRSFEHFKGNYQHYIFKDMINNIVFTAVPINYISNYYRPQEAVYELMHMDAFDPLQEKAFDFIVYLSKKANIPIEDFGLTGSILLDIHNPTFSDIDLTVHGHESAIKVENLVKKEFKNENSLITRISFQEKQDWIQRKCTQYKLKKEQVELVYKRKWNFGYFNNVKFSIHPIKKDLEVTEEYGTQTFENLGFIEVKARIKDHRESIYLPSKYKIEDIEIIEGEKIENLFEVISFEGIYSFMAKKNELVEIRGKLEKVISDDETYHRIVIGSFNAKEQDYILPIEEE